MIRTDHPKARFENHRNYRHPNQYSTVHMYPHVASWYILSVNSYLLFLSLWVREPAAHVDAAPERLEPGRCRHCRANPKLMILEIPKGIFHKLEIPDYPRLHVQFQKISECFGLVSLTNLADHWFLNLAWATLAILMQRSRHESIYFARIPVWLTLVGRCG